MRFLPLIAAIACLPCAAVAELPIIRNLHAPDVSPDGTLVAFSYQGDIWVAPIDAEPPVAERLTVHPAYESTPRFSPDGETLAFVSNRHGSSHIYTVPARGGRIERITEDSGGAGLVEWSPSGDSILFNSGGREHRRSCPYELDLATGYVRPVFEAAVNCDAGAYSPDGARVCGTRLGQAWWRKGYRGSGNAEVYVYDRAADELEVITEFDGSDRWPMFSGDGQTLYWVSESGGRPNLYAMDVEAREPRPLTHYGEDAVTFPSIAWTPEGDVLVYEWNFDLWTLRPGTPPRKLEIRAPIDHLENFESDETRTSGPEEIAASRDGSWVAFTVAGDIFLAKTDFENGSLRVTDFPGADGDLAWHPNGEELAYVTQQPEQPGIWVHDAAAREGRLLVAADERYLDIVGYTADGTRLLYQRGSGADGVWSADPETGESELLVDLPDVLGVRVSPDGQWIAATVDHALSGRDIYIRPMDGGEWTNVTVHPDGNMQPYWAPDGSKLFFVSARTDQWQIYAVDLTPQPVEFEDYQAQFEEAEEDEGGDDQAPTERPEDWPEWKPVPIDEMPIELRDIEERAQRLSSSGQGEAILGFTADGERLVFERGGEVFTMDFEGEDETRILGDDGLSQAHLTADGAKVFAVRDGDIVHGGTAKPGGVAEVSFRVELDQDRRILQKAAFRQAWTIYDQAFYTGTFHGSDWEAVYEHYAAHCTGTLVQEDFNRLVNRMIGELNASHSGCFGGRGFPGDTTGRLGITRDPEHAGPGVRVAHVLRMGPLDHPNTRVRRGEYLLAINGQEVNNTEHFSELLAGTVGERVKVMVNAEPTLEGARELSVKPISPGAENGIEYRERIAARREQAHRLSDGRVYYLHISGMGPSQLDEFERELFGPAQHYDAVIIDVRDNGGGNIHDPLYEILTRRVHGWIAQRGAPLRSQPFQFFDGPLCVMTNQYSFSDAEIFPQGFQDKGLGAIIGMDTPGGVIGVGVARLVNGSAVAVPATGWYRLDEGTIENEGVRVDIEVPYTYAEYRRGRDPQLEAAVEYLLAELETRSRTRPPTVDGHVAPRP